MCHPKLRSILNLEEFEAAAKTYLPKSIFGYVAGGTEDGATLRDNRAAFAEYRFLPRVLRDVSRRNAGARLFDRDYTVPFGVAPMGILALSAYRGDVVVAEAATRLGMPMIMSGSSLIRLEDVLAVAPDTWFQAYLPGERERIVALIDRVQAAGCKTLVITVDSAVFPNRENNLRVGFKTPLKPSFDLFWEGANHPAWSTGTFLRTIWRHGMPHFENNYAERGAPLVARDVERDFSGRAHLGWSDIAAIRRQWHGRLVLKGILRPDDANEALEHGVDGIVVSNHGGRQLDGSPSPMRVLPAVKAASGKMAVMVDSGFRRGTDVLKALALGADFVFIGRPFNYAAAIAGAAGIEHAFALLHAEMLSGMGLLGVNQLDEMDVSMLTGAAPTTRNGS